MKGGADITALQKNGLAKGLARAKAEGYTGDTADTFAVGFAEGYVAEYIVYYCSAIAAGEKTLDAALQNLGLDLTEFFAEVARQLGSRYDF